MKGGERHRAVTPMLKMKKRQPLHIHAKAAAFPPGTKLKMETPPQFNRQGKGLLLPGQFTLRGFYHGRVCGYLPVIWLTRVLIR